MQSTSRISSPHNEPEFNDNFKNRGGDGTGIHWKAHLSILFWKQCTLVNLFDYFSPVYVISREQIFNRQCRNKVGEHYRNYINCFYLRNKIPFLDMCGDINLVGHVFKSHKVRMSLLKIWSRDNQFYISIQIQNLYLICYISILDQFKLFKTSDTVFHTRLSWFQNGDIKKVQPNI